MLTDYERYVLSDEAGRLHIMRKAFERLERLEKEVERLKNTPRQPLKIDARPLNMQFRCVTTSQPP